MDLVHASSAPLTIVSGRSPRKVSEDIVESRVDISIWHVRYGMRSSCLEGSDAESLVVGKEDTTRHFRLNRVENCTTLNIV